MTRISIYWFAVLLMVSLLSCEKEDNNEPNNNNNNNNNTTLSNNPDAKPEFDNNAGGIYKGIVTGSAGYVVIHFKNENQDLVYALLKFDNITDSLICPSLNGYLFPGPDINEAVFVSAKGTQDSIIFSVKGDGTNPVMDVRIPGHKTKSSIKKETSKAELKVYKGMGNDTLVAGHFNCNGNPVPGGTTLGTVRHFPVTIMVQSGIAVFLGGRPLDCPENDAPDAGFVNIGPDNKIEFPDPGPPNRNAKFTVTDKDVTGTFICTIPINLNGVQDGYNTYIKADRVD